MRWFGDARGVGCDEFLLISLQAMSQEKLKDIPAFLRSRVTAENIKTNFDLFSADYKKKYIDTGMPPWSMLQPLHPMLLSVEPTGFSLSRPGCQEASRSKRRRTCTQLNPSPVTLACRVFHSYGAHDHWGLRDCVRARAAAREGSLRGAEARREAPLIVH